MKKTLILIGFMLLTGCADKVDIKVKKVSFLCNSDKYQNYKKFGGIGQSFHPSHEKGIFAIELLTSKNLNKYPNVKFNYKNILSNYDWKQNLDKKIYYSPYVYFNPINPKELLVFTDRQIGNKVSLKDLKTEHFEITARSIPFNELQSNDIKIRASILIDAVNHAGFKELSMGMCHNSKK